MRAACEQPSTLRTSGLATDERFSNSRERLHVTTTDIVLTFNLAGANKGLTIVIHQETMVMIAAMVIILGVGVFFFILRKSSN